MSEVKFFRLATGEEVVVTVLANEEDHYIVKNPMALMMTQVGETNFFPLFPYCNTDNMKILKNMIEFDLQPREDLLDSYNKSFPTIKKFGEPMEGGCYR